MRNSLNLAKNFQEHTKSRDTLVSHDSKRLNKQETWVSQKSDERMKKAYKPMQKLINQKSKMTPNYQGQLVFNGNLGKAHRFVLPVL